MNTPAAVESLGQQTLTAILDHHEALYRELDERVRALRMVVHTRAEYERPLAALVAFVEESVLPHAAAEEATLYPAAATDPGTSLLVEGMGVEHRALEDRAGALANARSPVYALAAAESFAAVFTVHVEKENVLLLPALARNPEVNLAALVQAMRQHLDEPHNDS